jgi:hypothetical protein
VDLTSNPDYASWVAKDQIILNFLLSNMSKEILGQVNTYVTVLIAWPEGVFASSRVPRSLVHAWLWTPPLSTLQK